MSIYDGPDPFQDRPHRARREGVAEATPGRPDETLADEDVAFIEAQMAVYQERLALWYRRVWQLIACGWTRMIGYCVARE
jgi:hypothetical protein